MAYNLFIFLFIALLLFITLEDFRYRAVSWWTFPLFVVMSFIMNNMKIEIMATFINMGFIVLQVLLLTIYFSVRQKRIVNVTKDYLGWGDVLFWIALCLLFSPLNFFSFYFISMFLSFLVAIVMRIINKKNSFIPLAGIQAFVLAIVLLINIVFHIIEFQNDKLIEDIITG